MLLRRVADLALRSALDRQAAVALIGPRQVGKTTLARALGAERGALYLDLEDREEHDSWASPDSTWSASPTGWSSSTRSTGSRSCFRPCAGSSTRAAARAEGSGAT